MVPLHVLQYKIMALFTFIITGFKIISLVNINNLF